MRRRHRGARGGGVGLVNDLAHRGPVRAARMDLDAGKAQVGFDPAIGSRAARGEGRERVMFVGRADGNDFFRGARRANRSPEGAIVARRDTDDDAALDQGVAGDGEGVGAIR